MEATKDAPAILEKAVYGSTPEGVSDEMMIDVLARLSVAVSQAALLIAHEVETLQASIKPGDLPADSPP